MAHTPRPELRADDPIQKFQGRWVGADGWEWPFHARYVAWAIWAIVFPLVLVGDWVLTGAISPLPLIDLIVSVALTTVLANLTNGEISLGHALVYLQRTARIGVARAQGRLSPERPKRARHVLRVCRLSEPVLSTSGGAE
jgi:hypothetical protein